MNSKNLNTLAILALLSLLCATSRAQTSMPAGSEVIYSNAFNTWPSGLPYTSVYQTPPTYVTSTNLNGASGSAVWSCTFTNLNPAVNNPGGSVPPYGAGTVYLNGTTSTNQGCALLPLTVLTNTVYVLQASATLPSPISSDVRMGFTVNNGSTISPDWDTNIGVCRFNDSPPNGYAWNSVRTSVAPTFFGGPRTGQSTSGGSGGSAITAGTCYMEIILSTLNNTNAYAITNALHHGETNDWVASAFINGNQLGTNVIYTSSASGVPPFALGYCGLGSGGFPSGGSTAGIQWNYFTVSTPLAPIIVQQPLSATVNQNSIFTNTVVAIADTNGGTLGYQWYTNGIPLSNGGNISGATNASLTINPVLSVDIATNFSYYVVISNTFGSVTSAPVNLTVLGGAQFTTAFPLTYTNSGPTNLMSLYGSSGSYAGSSPFFQVFAAGAQPIAYFWYTNGVNVGGVNSTNYALTNVSMTGPTTFVCVASNSVGEATNIWAATYLPSPTTPFQAAVMAAHPLAYWRLNDTNLDGVDNGNGNNGYVCHDYESGNNGIYTNTILANNQPGVGSYSPTTDPNGPSAQFGVLNGQLNSEDANSIGGNNIDFSSSSNAEYTVALWANGFVAQGAEQGNAGLFCKGYFSGEEACIDIDPHTFNVRLTLRNAAGTQFNVVSTEYLGTDPDWHYIVGTCDESNGLISLYVDGVLQGQTSIPTNSGIINSANTPIMIGARSSDALPADAGNNQFQGNINDVAVYGYAMSASTIISQYQAAGYTVTPYVLLLSGPPTNVVYLVNSTVTLSATAYGSPPFGYYWTNLTTGGVIQSGSASVAGPLNATLTIPNISSSLSGDQLELVVTNSSASTNLIVFLSATPAPIALGYTNGILYSNSFDGGTYSINGTALSAANLLVGGTNATWVNTYTNASGLAVTINGNGTLGTNQGEALMPFTPEAGYIYTMTGTLLEPSSMSDFVHMGFCQSDAQTSNGAIVRFNDPPINGYDFLALENASITFYGGPGAANAIGAYGSVPIGFPVINTMQIVLNCVTNNGWVASASVNGAGIGTNYYTNNFPPIAYAGIGQQVTAGSAQWQSWALTQYAPGGVPPYLMVRPPTNSILLTNATITLPATAFGSVPIGYYWSDNATVIASGTTNIVAPISANLSVPSSSLSAGQLELVVTNAYGTNITLITLISPVNANPTNIVFSTASNPSQMTLSWPLDHTGWQLQAQTNLLTVGISSNWVNVAGSTATNKILIPINLTNGTVFYRLIYTP